MQKSATIVISFALLIILLGLFAFGKSTASPPTSPTSQTKMVHEYYWSQTCPRCANVKDFLNNWEMPNSFNLKEKEIDNNKENINLLRGRADSCNLPKDKIGVPFLYTPEGECIVGDKPIIDYLERIDQ